MKKTNIQTFQQAKKGPRILLPLHFCNAHFNFMGKYGTNSHPVWPWLIGLEVTKAQNNLESFQSRNCHCFKYSLIHNTKQNMLPYMISGLETILLNFLLTITFGPTFWKGEQCDNRQWMAWGCSFLHIPLRCYMYESQKEDVVAFLYILFIFQ